MTAIAIILNIVFAAAVIVGIVGLLSRSIRDTKGSKGPSRWPAELAAVPVRSVPRRRRATTRAQALGRTPARA
jgi:hypothetical protein